VSNESTFVPLLLITLLAAVVPVLVGYFGSGRLPIVVGEILAGIVVGQSGFNLITTNPTIDFLAQFGFVFLMFLSGLEVDFRALTREREGDAERPRWQRPVPLASLSFGLTVVLAVAIGYVLNTVGLTHNPILMGLILSATSLGVVLPTLKERDLVVTIYGQTLLLASVISDFATLLLLSIVIAVISRGFGIDLLLFVVLALVFGVAAKIGQWARRVPVLTRVIEQLSHATAQIQERGAFALMVAWVVLAESLGVEVILGAFLAGAIISLMSPGYESQLRGKLDAIGYGFFIPIFFIMVGERFDLRALFESKHGLLLVPILVISAYLIRIVAVGPFRALFSWRETIAAIVLLTSQLSLTVAAAAIALELGIISAAVNSAIILVAIITCTVSPFLFSLILPHDEATRRDGVIVVGTDQLAVLLGERVRAAGERVTFLGHSLEQLEHLRDEGFRAVVGKPSDIEVLEEAGADTARALVAVSQTPGAVLDVCRIAYERFQIPDVIARSDDPEQVRELQALNVRVVQPVMATALSLEGALNFPAAFNMLNDKSGAVELLDVPLSNAQLAGRRLRSIRLPGNALVLGVRRGDEFVVPHGDTVLEHGDMLMLVGSPDSLREARPWLVYGVRLRGADAPTRGAYPTKNGVEG
jgi:Kef-type K+ transport system membrane component KefB/Trk K+ transport system NAD-binding subunit